MPSSWSESDRLHSSNMRSDAATAELDAFRSAELDEIIIEDIIEDNYDGAFSRFEEPEDRYLDSMFEERYYLAEPDFDIY